MKKVDKKILQRLVPPFLLLLFLQGCQPLLQGENSPVSPVERQDKKEAGSGPGSEPVDTTCSYFYFLWGRHAELSRHLEEALEAYEKALICDPGADYIMRKLPMLLIRLGRNGEAVDWLKKSIVAHPKEVGTRLLLAKVYSRQKKYDEAIAQYRAALDLDPRDETATLLLGELHARRRHYDLAEKTVTRLLEEKEDWYAGHVFLARIHVNQQRYDEALEEYETALGLNWSAELIYEMGELLRNLDRPKEAVALYRQILDRDESGEKARIAIVHTYLGMQRDDLALEELKKLREITDHPARIDLIVSRIYARRKKYDRATSILERLISEEDLPEARYLLAMIHLEREDPAAALEELGKIGPEADEYEESVILRVKILRQQEKSDEAVALLREVLSRDEPPSADLSIILAGLYLSRGQGEKGKAVLQKAMQLYPEDNDLLYEYGLFLDQKGEPAQALAVMERVIKADPDHSGALNYVGYTWADRGENLQRALEYIQRAVALKPENAYIRDSLGWVYFRLGKIEKARTELLKALNLAGGDPHIHDHLGDVYRNLGLVEKARHEYEQALELFGDHKDAPATREKLDVLLKKSSDE